MKKFFLWLKQTFCRHKDCLSQTSSWEVAGIPMVQFSRHCKRCNKIVDSHTAMDWGTEPMAECDHDWKLIRDDNGVSLPYTEAWEYYECRLCGECKGV